MKRALLTAVVMTAWAGVPLFAHHSFAATYFEDQTVTVEGDLVEFEYRAPHAWVHLTVKDMDGKVVRFSGEWANPPRLSQSGVTIDTLKIGDHLVMGGSPSRTTGEHRLHLKRLQRPLDGWMWGGLGRGGPGGPGGPGRGGPGRFGRGGPPPGANE